MLELLTSSVMTPMDALALTCCTAAPHGRIRPSPARPSRLLSTPSSLRKCSPAASEAPRCTMEPAGVAVVAWTGAAGFGAPRAGSVHPQLPSPGSRLPSPSPHPHRSSATAGAVVVGSHRQQSPSRIHEFR